MKTVLVVQHTEAEYLGLIEDHFEGRNIRFSYARPFAHGGGIPAERGSHDGLVLLGAGPYGLVSGHLLPSAMPEMRLTKAFLDAGLPVVGIELGALILGAAAGGGADEAPLRLEIAEARRMSDDALGGHLPARFPLACYLRDRPVLPPGAEVLAADDDGAPLVFSIGGRSLGFLGHPGTKSGMVEDLVMEFAETPPGTAEALAALRGRQGEVAAALSDMMVGICRHTGLM
jgi:GMP synthase-like glutamine amidotransferase